MIYKVLAITLLATCLCIAAPTTQSSREGNFHVQLPDGWKALTEGMEAYDLYLIGPGRAFLFCNSEAKEDFAEPEQALSQQAERKIAEMPNWMTEISIGEQQSLQIGANRAIRFEARGLSQGMKMIQVITIVETPTRIIVWTGVSSPSRIEQHRPMFEQIIATVCDGQTPATQPANGK